MNRLVRQFAALAVEKRAALILYLTAGDPALAETPGLILEAARAGADVIELGVPWSDPSADGPVIQAAMERALSTGGAGRDTIEKTLEVVRAVRRESEVPIVLFGYYNPLLQRGLPRLVDEARAVGVDGLLVVDLPPEESEELDGLLAAAQISRVPLLSPVTSAERAGVLCARASGFAYYVAFTGVTGAARLDVNDVRERSQALRPAVGELPLAVGFGVRDAAGARALAEFADGVVVGSALVAAVAAAADPEARRAAVREFTAALSAALRDARRAG
jgi:tryptophan synthase alpha chain